MKKELVIQLGEYQIVAEIYDKDTPEFPPELMIYLRDKDGVINQDICLVRPHYRYNENKGEFVIENDLIDCLVWGDSDYEDYTDKYVIGVYKEGEEE